MCVNCIIATMTEGTRRKEPILITRDPKLKETDESERVIKREQGVE
jgi:hypothetical protein